MLGDELSVRDIFIEGLDNIVPIAVSRRAKVVLFVSIRFSEPDQIKPVAAPSFPVSGVLQELIDKLFVGGIRSFDASEFLDGGWDSDQIKVDAADEGTEIRVGADRQLMLQQTFFDERVDRV